MNELDVICIISKLNHKIPNLEWAVNSNLKFITSLEAKIPVYISESGKVKASYKVLLYADDSYKDLYKIWIEAEFDSEEELVNRRCRVANFGGSVDEIIDSFEDWVYQGYCGFRRVCKEAAEK